MIDFNDLTIVYSKKNITDQSWTFIGKQSVLLIQIIQIKNGSFLGIDTSFNLLSKTTLMGTWSIKEPT